MTIPSSAAFNTSQASMPPMTGNPTLGGSTTTTSITLTVNSGTLNLASGGTISVPTTTQTYSGLTANTPYYFDIAWDAASASVYVNNSVMASATPYTSAPTDLQRMTDCYHDGRINISAAKSISTPSSGTGGVSGGGKAEGCPAATQLIRTLERGMVEAKELLPGMHLLDSDTSAGEKWNRIHTARLVPDQIVRVILSDDVVEVNAGHMVMTARGWRLVTSLKRGDKVCGYPSGFMKFRSLEQLGSGLFVALTCENRRYVLGRALHHNWTL